MTGQLHEGVKVEGHRQSREGLIADVSQLDGRPATGLLATKPRGSDIWHLQPEMAAAAGPHSKRPKKSFSPDGSSESGSHKPPRKRSRTAKSRRVPNIENLSLSARAHSERGGYIDLTSKDPVYMRQVTMRLTPAANESDMAKRPVFQSAGNPAERHPDLRQPREVNKDQQRPRLQTSVRWQKTSMRYWAVTNCVSKVSGLIWKLRKSARKTCRAPCGIISLFRNRCAALWPDIIYRRTSLLFTALNI